MAERPMNVIPDRAGIFDDLIDEPAEDPPQIKSTKPRSLRSRNRLAPTKRKSTNMASE